MLFWAFLTAHSVLQQISRCRFYIPLFSKQYLGVLDLVLLHEPLLIFLCIRRKYTILWVLSLSPGVPMDCFLFYTGVCMFEVFETCLGYHRMCLLRVWLNRIPATDDRAVPPLLCIFWYSYILSMKNSSSEHGLSYVTSMSLQQLISCLLGRHPVFIFFFYLWFVMLLLGIHSSKSGWPSTSQIHESCNALIVATASLVCNSSAPKAVACANLITSWFFF